MHSPSPSAASRKHSSMSSGDSRAQSKALFGDREETSKDVDRFEKHMTSFQGLEFPGMRPEDSLKNRYIYISQVEMGVNG